MFQLKSCFSDFWVGVVKSWCADPNLDLLCIQQLGAASLCENYAKLNFDAKHLEKGWNRGW